MHDGDLPDEFARELGLIVYRGGQVEHLLGKLLPSTPTQPGTRGLSGGQLIEELRALPQAEALATTIKGYEEQQEWRNRLTHGASHFAAGILWVWHVPIKDKGKSAQSYQFRLEDLQLIAESWKNLAIAAHQLLHERPSR